MAVKKKKKAKVKDRNITIVHIDDDQNILYEGKVSKLKGAYLKGADLTCAHLRGVDLRGVDLRDADLTCANLTGAYLTDAYLTCADLTGAHLRGADLRGADLQGADLRGADLRGADLTGADLTGADFGKYISANIKRGKHKINMVPLQLSGLNWHVIIWDKHMEIGCESHSFKQWRKFSDKRIYEMDKYALRFWDTHKEMLMGMCETR